MKTLKNLSIVFATILFSMAMLSSCQKEESLSPVNTTESSELVQQVKTTSYFTTKMSCLENLVQDAGQCYYTSGEGKDMDNYMEMIDMLNNCHAETLPDGCEWLPGNETVTEII